MTQEMEKLPKDSFERITIDSSHAEKISKPSLSFWQDAWLRIRKNKAAIVSMFILAFIVFMAFVGPMIGPMIQKHKQLHMQTYHRKFQGLKN